MSATAIALVAASVVLHVLWNLVAKNRPSFAFFFFGNLIGAIVLLPVVFVHRDVLVQLPTELWWILVGTGVAQTVYGFALAAAYRQEALSLVYPLVRSLGPAFVVLGSLALGRGEAIGWACIAGVFAILLGGAALGIVNLRALGMPTLPRAGITLSIVSALGTMGYTLLDDAGVRLVLASGALATLGNETLRAGLLYASFEGWTTAIGMGLFMLHRSDHRAALRAYRSRAELRDAAIMGIGSYTAYAFVLVAMLYASDVSYVAGFRQLSIPLGAAVGVLWLGEAIDARRLFGLLVMLCGLWLIAFA